MVPTVLRQGGYRFFFFSREPQEPPHIHVECGDGYAKYWLDPVGLAACYGIKSHELRRIREIVSTNSELFRRKWHEYFQ